MAIFSDNCNRCGKHLKQPHNSVFSVFNGDFICKKCDKRERHHPAYPKAKKYDDKRTERFISSLKRGVEIKEPFFG